MIETMLRNKFDFIDPSLADTKEFIHRIYHKMLKSLRWVKLIYNFSISICLRWTNDHQFDFLINPIFPLYYKIKIIECILVSFELYQLRRYWHFKHLIHKNIGIFLLLQRNCWTLQIYLNNNETHFLIIKKYSSLRELIISTDKNYLIQYPHIFAWL